MATIIVNEFGEAGLDDDLIEESSEVVVLMSSGCLCCSVRGDLSETVARLIQRRSVEEISFDRLLIETTAGPILQKLHVDRVHSQHTCVDDLVTVADAMNGNEALDAQFEEVSQGAMADLIILSKSDLAKSNQVKNFEDRLGRLNPTVRILRSVGGEGLAADL